MEQMSWKMLIVTKAFLLYLTCAFKVTVARQQEGVCATCHVNATCDDKRDGRGGKVCNCMYGFLGNGRTRCQDKDECQIGGGKICGDHTVCHNTYGSFYCTCLSGYSPSNSLVIFIPNDGTQCNDIDECKVQGICGEGGWCINMQGDFNCRCRAGYKVQNGSQPFHPHRDKAVCTAIDCGQPPSVTHAAQLSEAGTRYGSVAQFGCVKGFFQTRGNNTAVCGEKGVWEGLSLVCEEIYCGEPPALPHSVMQWHKLAKVGTNVYYKCNAGYYNVGAGNFSVCNTSGQWDKTSMQCEEINCGPPVIFPNTDIHWDNTSRLGSIVRYTCEYGFYQEGGSSHSTCTSARVWENITVACKEIDCGDPPFHPHSIVEWNNSTKIGTEVSYQCKPGFYNAGYGNVSLCTTDGYWNHTNILCQEINCGPPVIFPNTDIHWDNTSRLGSVLHYTCEYGFHKEGESSHSTCTSARVWENITVACKEIDCGDPPFHPHSIMVWNNSTKIGTEVSYQCKPGFYNAGYGNVSLCTTDGYWNHANILCQEINCGPPVIFPNTDIHWDNTSRLGSVVHYTCDYGFYQEGGSGHSTCTSARVWEHITVACKEINCGPPAVFPNTDIHWDNTTRLGSVVHYTCKNGFYQEGGSSNSTCSSAREWEHITITCKEINCGPPDVFPNTDIHWDNTTRLGSVVHYTCKNGFYQEGGSSNSTCSSAREWEHITITCKARCGPPPSLPHTEVEWQNGSIAGSVALHSCQKGYRSWRGVNLSLCADTGRWQAATLFCREIKPAISKLLIFNEKCLRWKAERYDGQGEDYTVQIVGSRDYQRTFQYKRKRVFSTAADWPELCLNLLPGTNYTINITALSAGFSSIISANTSIQAPPVPEVVFRDVEVPLPSLRLRRSINTLDPISVYQVFVVPLERPVAFDCRSVSESHYHRQRPMGLYVAAQIPVVDIGRELSFTLGDQRYYGEYYNAPLLPGRDYYIILRAVNQWGRVRKQSCVFWAKARGTPYIIQSATMVTGGLIGLVAFVIFLGWYCKNK
ncbi:sushi domain-containing protein 1 isoform X3 [Conger conger]|uniref:sushi domain-containing protein 1 isoform X3 n=1 Tax=Conger conger TaxID=82655 RepID=UPI002A5A7AAC|nr:sushi domain-containing protein 1 isoform X3 [Conger conger]